MQAILVKARLNAKSRPEGAACDIDPTTDRISKEQGKKGNQAGQGKPRECITTEMDTCQGSQGDCRQPNQPGIRPALDNEPPQDGQYSRTC